MKIILAHNTYQQAGGEDSVLDAEKTLLQEYGHEVLIFKITNDSIRNFKDKIKTVLSVNYSLQSRKDLAYVIRKFKPDIVHVHNFFPLLTPSIYDACFEAGIPVVQTLHNYRTICPGALLMRDGHICEDCITGSAYQAVLHGCYRGSRFGSLVVARMVEHHRKHRTWSEKVDRFIALTEFAKQKFIQAGFPEDKIKVKPNFVAREINEVEFIKSGKPYALFVGRLSKEKGVETLLQAWEYLSHPLYLVGDGPLLSQVQSVESTSIICFGHMLSKDVRQKMAQAEFLVMPSEWYEGFPMVLVEAFSLGLPVLASRLGSMAEIVEDGVTGLHFDAGNPVDLANKVKWMIEHPKECEQIGKNARAVFFEKYTAEINYKILMNIYNEILQIY